MKKQLVDIPIEINIRGIQSKIINDTESITMKNLILGANESIPNHQVPVDVTFFILTGTGIITIGGKKHNVLKDDVVICPPNVVMSVHASNEGLSFINIKTPGIKVKK